ncbi:hypothetical protein N7U66_10045 [Lacinutrix neustonica]|uniref:Lipoprotein n=1 Tax=Lacinutrix neustonica TaxID=2980107 RepID=A0A9E8MYJ0_9FLAO|nr:hypothetical protein [Lacinutrix neustonica]WAC03731.1 hypothetical protein N7U66_10045 [Lacinutrix neustonica]
MKKILSLFTIVILIYSCGCDDEIVYSNKLTEFEKSLIPYTAFDNSYFLDENGNSIRASFDPRKFEIYTDRPGPESCQLQEYENLNGAVRFISKDLELTLELNTLYERRQFKINEYYYGNDNLGINFFQNCENGLENNPFDNRLENITLLNFEFTDVIILEDCSRRITN